MSLYVFILSLEHKQIVKFLHSLFLSNFATCSTPVVPTATVVSLCISAQERQMLFLMI